jgi:hypothetical protein
MLVKLSADLHHPEVVAVEEPSVALALPVALVVEGEALSVEVA